MELEVQKFLRSGGTLEKVMAAVEAVALFSGEGVVVRDAAYRRVKVKSAAYPYSGVLFWLHSGVEVGE